MTRLCRLTPAICAFHLGFSVVTDRWAIMQATEGLFGKVVVDWSPPNMAFSPTDEVLLTKPGFTLEKNADIAGGQGLDG